MEEWKKNLLQLQYSRNVVLTMDQDTETTRKPLSTCKENINRSLKSI